MKKYNLLIVLNPFLIICCSDKNENEFCLESEWQSRVKLEDHFRGKGLTLLMGAINVLCEKPEVNINDAKASYEMEFIEAVLGE